MPHPCYSPRMADQDVDRRDGYLRAWSLYATGQHTHREVYRTLREEGWQVVHP